MLNYFNTITDYVCLSLMVFFAELFQIEKLEKSNGKLQLSRKKTQEALSKVDVTSNLHNFLNTLMLHCCFSIS